MENNREIFIIISQTPTGFAKFIRKHGHIRFNHASISFDKDLTSMYGFARPQYGAVLLARLVKESYTSFTLNKNTDVPVMIFKMNISEEQLNEISDFVHKIEKDEQFMYNLFSVLTFPVVKGFTVHKAYTCIEFVMKVLEISGYKADRPLYKYKPDDLVNLLEEYKVFEGDVREVLPETVVNEKYFDKMTMRLRFHSVCVLLRLLGRSIRYKEKGIFGHKEY